MLWLFILFWLYIMIVYRLSLCNFSYLYRFTTHFLVSGGLGLRHHRLLINEVALISKTYTRWLDLSGLAADRARSNEGISAVGFHQQKVLFITQLGISQIELWFATLNSILLSQICFNVAHHRNRQIMTIEEVLAG